MSETENHKAQREHESSQKNILDLSIEDLELTVRTYNCLKIAKIKTLGQLAETSIRDLLCISNFGRRPLYEVRKILASYNLTLKDDT